MVTLHRASYQSQIRADRYCGTSTEEKPIKNVENGSWFTEIDTGKKYRFDAENQKWDIQISECSESSNCTPTINDIGTLVFPEEQPSINNGSLTF